MKMCIDYARIARAIEFYSARGYQYVDAKWTAPEHIMKLTMPDWVSGIEATLIGPLVGSGEQYFMNEMFNNRLQPGRYCCATPCFRDDPEDELHGSCFFKVELIDTKYLEIDAMLAIAQDFFKSEGINTNITKVASGHMQRDLVASGSEIELGSYGIRESVEIGSWLYGTALAEPRFSIAKGYDKDND